jgi:HlyD family secretion protein
MTTRKTLRCTIALTLLALTVSGCPKPGGAPGGMDATGGGMSGPPPVAVIVAPVVMEPYAPAIELTGEARAAQQATLASEVAGKVVAVTRRVGESQPKGGVLISIDPASYQTALTAAQADLAAAQQQLQRLQAGPREEEIRAQEAAVAAAEAQYKQAQDNLERQRQLYSQGVIPQTAIVAAQTQADAAQAGLEAARQVLENIRLGSRKEDIGAAQARVDQAASGVAAAQLQLSRTTISTAFDAVVSALFVEVGQFVGPGTPVCEIVAAGPAEAWFNLPQDLAAQVKPGAMVELRVDALPEAKLTGSVISIAPAADAGTRQFPVRVACGDERLKPGMTLRGRILTAAPVPTLMLSDDAAVLTKLGQAVYRMVPAAPDAKPSMPGMPALPTVESVPVETGAHYDGLVVLVKGDLKPGDMVVTRGKESLYPSANIIPTNLMNQGGAGGGPPGAGGEGVTADGTATAGGAETTPPAAGTPPGDAVAPPGDAVAPPADDSSQSGGEGK